VDSTREPEVPEIVIVYAPGGVPLLVVVPPLVLLPPQAISGTASVSAKTTSNIDASMRGPCNGRNRSVPASASIRAEANNHAGHPDTNGGNLKCWKLPGTMEFAVVLIVREEVVEAAPGVTELGLKAQVASEGRFEQESATALVKGPIWGVIVTW
jgi:hypothetical protein